MMTRVATIPLQRTMADAIQKSQQKLAVTQQRLASGKKAVDFADLGTETVRNLSAHSLLARQDAHSAVAKRVGTTLSLYSGHLDGIETASSDLRQQILTAVGTGKAAGLQDAIEAAFNQFRSSLNAGEGGSPLFAGSQTSGDPFKVATLADAATMTASEAFANDDIRASARVSDGVDVTYGLTASSVGGDLFEAFKTLAQAGVVSDTPDEAQKAALAKAAGELEKGLATLRLSNASNGRAQAQVESLETRGEARALLLHDVIERNEDADLGQVAIDLAQQKTMLEASYSVFSQLSSLSLVRYL